MKRVLMMLGMGAVLSASLAACGKPPNYIDVVDQAMTRTAANPRSFIYTEQYAGNTTTVQGIVADDFRYKALVGINGTPSFQEIVADDAIADQALNAQGLSLFQRKVAIPGVRPTSPDDASVDPLQLLSTHHWVEDSRGAPSDVATAAVKHVVGDDPIFDALTTFRYVDTAMHEAKGVIKFNKDSLDYKPKEDPFPQPKPGSGVVRYDLVLKKIPKASDVGVSGQRAPDISDFRKLSVYVKDGLVVQILEDVDVISRLNDLQKNYNLKFGTSDPQKAAAEAVSAINAVNQAQGQDPIRARVMSIKFTDVGKAQSIDLPTDAIAGNLAVLENRGYLTPQQQAALAQASGRTTGT